MPPESTTTPISAKTVVSNAVPDAVSDAAVAQQSRRALYVALLVAGAFFMENLDGTIIATALPQMARTFGVHPIDLNVGMTAYLLTLAVFIPISGWMADRWGARTVFGTAIAVFTGASILCGMCNGVATFTGARVLQGIGGAMMVPVGRLAVLRTTEKKDLMRAIAYIMWPGLAAPILGPPVGGYITLHASWRWIFFLNVPLGAIALGLTLILIANRREAERKPFDFLGFVLSGLACVTLVYGLDLIGRQQIPYLTVGLLIAASVVFGVLLVRRLRRHPHPLFDLDALRIPTFAITIWGGSLFRIAIGAMPFLLPLLFQIGFGLDPYTSGKLVLAVFAGNLGMKPLTTTILKRWGFRGVLTVNGVLAALTIFACAVLGPRTPHAVVIVVLFAGGLCRSMQFTALNTLGYADVPKPQMSGATTFSSMINQLTFGMGIAWGAVALRIGTLFHANAGALMVADFRVAFVLTGIIALAATWDCFGLVPHAGAEVSGHR